MTERVSVDPEAMLIWKRIESEEEGIEPKNWVSLNYKSPKALVLSGSGERGLYEAREQVFKRNEITICIVMGCQKRGRNNLDLIRIVFLWMPKKISPLAKAHAILDVDEVVQRLELKYFCLLEAYRKKHVTIENTISQVKKIRGEGENQGKYHFDENVSILRKKRYDQLKQTITDSLHQSLKNVQEFRRKESHVLRELFSTERHYVKCMNLLEQKYVVPLKIHGHPKDYSFIHSMVNTIIMVNGDYYDSLKKVYDLCDESKNETEFQKRLNELDESFFTPSKISEILDASQKHFKTFQFYGPYICSYERMVSMIGTLLSEDKKLESHYQSSQTELRKSGNRNTDFASFLIMPIQRIPRYQLLMRELSKYYIGGEDDPNCEKIKTTQGLVKKLAMLVNEKKESMAKTVKTIEISKSCRRPDLMAQRMLKFRTIRILHRKKLLKKKSSSLSSSSTTDTVQGKSGELYLFEHLLLIVRVKKEKAFGFLSSMVNFLQEQDQQEDGRPLAYKLKYEFSLKHNPNFRCHRHPEQADILEIEDEKSRFSLKLESVERCEDMLSLIQQQLSIFFDHRAMTSLYSTRIVYKSWLGTKLESDSSSDPKQQQAEVLKNQFHVISADLKLDVYKEEEEVVEDNPIRSYSLIGAKKYGVTSKVMMDRKLFRMKNRSSKKKKRKSKSNLFASAVGTNFLEGMSSVPGLYDHIDDDDDDHLGKKKKYYWFYIIFSVSEKKIKRKRKSVEITKFQSLLEEKIVFFRADEKNILDVWMSILDRCVGRDKRFDDDDESYTIKEEHEEVEGEEEKEEEPNTAFEEGGRGAIIDDDPSCIILNQMEKKK